MRHTRRLQQGFSLLEAMVALGIMMIVTAFAMVQSFGSVESYRVNSAMDIVISQLRVARQVAISQRRNVTVSFTTATSPQKSVTRSWPIMAPASLMPTVMPRPR